MATPSPADGPPSVSLLGLPTEVKAHIVRLAKEQDAAFRARTARLDKQPQGSIERRILEVGVSEWHGRSLNALFRIKEFSTLAAVHLFKSVRASRMMEPAFRFSVLSRYPRIVREVEFDSAASQEQLEGALSNLPSFPLLDSISIDQYAADELLGNYVAAADGSEPESGDAVFHRRAFSAVARTITTVRLLNFAGEEAACMLAYFPNLRHLHLEVHHVDEPSELADVVVALPALESLSITKSDHDGDDYFPGLHSSWLTADWTKSKSLRILRYDAQELASSDWAFVEAISIAVPSLEAFDLCLDEGLKEGWGDCTHLLPEDAFPSLRSLRLRSWPSHIQSLLPFLSTLPLRTLDLSFPDIPDFGDDDPLPIHLATSSARTRISLYRYGENKRYWPTRADNFLEFLDWCRARNVPVDIKPDLFYDPFWSKPTPVKGADLDEERTRDVGRLRKAISEVLEFGTTRLMGLEREKDLAGLVEMAEGLVALKGRMLLEED